MAQMEQGGGWNTAITARRVMIVAALFIIGYFSLSIVSNVVLQNQLTNRQATLEREIETLERREARLQALRAYTETDAFIEAAARENGYARPGEIAVVTVGPAAETGQSPLEPGDLWWYRYLHPDDRR